MKQWIIEGQLNPNEKIIDTEIADYFGVSRTPVREAFQLLENQKLIRSYPGRTTLVTSIDTEHIEQCYSPMKVLQQLGISLAVENISPDSCQELTLINENFKAQIDASGKAVDILDCDKEFHDCILRIAQNKYIIDFCDTLWIHIQRLEYAFFKENPMPMESYQEHKGFIQALERKDSFSAEMMMKNHWDRTILQVRQLIHQKNV